MKFKLMSILCAFALGIQLFFILPTAFMEGNVIKFLVNIGVCVLLIIPITRDIFKSLPNN